MRRSSSCSASAISSSRRDLRVGARGSAPHHDLHDAHAGPGRARRLSVQPRRDAPGGRLGHARRVPRRVPGARPLRQRQRPAFNMTALALRTAELRQRRQPASRAASRARCGGRSGRASPTSSGRCGRSPTASTSPTWLSAEMSALFDAPPRRRTGAIGTTTAALWQPVLDIPDDGAVGRAACAPELPVRVHPRARAPALERRAGQRRTRSSRPARCSIRTP